MISIIMPVYNAERTLEQTLRSIRMQTIDPASVEILCIDGGSTDRTPEIARQYNAILLENPKRLPEYAKMLGITAAKGRYLIEQDSDENYRYPEQLRNRLDLFQKHPQVKAIVANRLLTPRSSDLLCAYLNEVGDPFTYFVYRNTGSAAKALRRCKHTMDGNAIIANIDDQSILPIGDGGTTMIDMDYVRDQFPSRVQELSFSSTIFQEVALESGYAACILNDDILHDSRASMKNYFQKLRFRIVNNLFDPNGSGFSSRQRQQKVLQKRKLLYPLYCLLLIWPVWDGIAMAVRNRNAIFLLHPVFAWYVLVETAFLYLYKLMGKKVVNQSYAKR